jgi:hypothetical protein
MQAIIESHLSLSFSWLLLQSPSHCQSPTCSYLPRARLGSTGRHGKQCGALVRHLHEALVRHLQGARIRHLILLLHVTEDSDTQANMSQYWSSLSYLKLKRIQYLRFDYKWVTTCTFRIQTEWKGTKSYLLWTEYFRRRNISCQCS